MKNIAALIDRASEERWAYHELCRAGKERTEETQAHFREWMALCEQIEALEK